jgi:hypothetical protein
MSFFLKKHFRNYLAELPRKGKQKGYEELSPNQTAFELFGHLQPGEKIAMTSRWNNPAAQAYLETLKERGLTVRMITNQTGVQDFCFLANAKKELAGMARSTFLEWAAILGNASVSWLYSIDSEDTRKALGDQALMDHQWTNPELKRLRFASFKPGNESGVHP